MRGVGGEEDGFVRVGMRAERKRELQRPCPDLHIQIESWEMEYT